MSKIFAGAGVVFLCVMLVAMIVAWFSKALLSETATTIGQLANIASAFFLASIATKLIYEKRQ